MLQRLGEQKVKEVKEILKELYDKGYNNGCDDCY